MFTINLKYFTDSENNYIIYRNSNSKDSDNSLKSQSVIVKDVILPTDNHTEIESTFDDLAKSSIKSQLEKMNLGSESSFSTVRILGNYKNLDISNPVYVNKILNINQIDKNHTLYRFCIVSEFYYPLNLENFVKTPWLFINAFFETLFRGSSEC